LTKKNLWNEDGMCFLRGVILILVAFVAVLSAC